MPANGYFAETDLSHIIGGVPGPDPGQGQLCTGASEAAASWNAMAHYIYGQEGIWIRVTGPDTAYRPYDRQVYYWNLYQSGQGNLAAYPGTSNHGWALAVDVPDYVRALIDKYGAPFGWAKAWSDAPTEWWHLKYATGHWTGPDPGTGTAPVVTYPLLREGSHGDAVKRAQKHLHRWNLGLTRPQISGKFGKFTKRAVEEFQLVHGLKSDGVIGAATWKKLIQKDHFYDDERTHINRARYLAHHKNLKGSAKKLRSHRVWCAKRARSIHATAMQFGWAGQHRRERYKGLKRISGNALK